MSNTTTFTFRKLVSRIAPFVKPLWWLILASLLFNLLFSAINALVLAVVDPVFRTLFGSTEAGISKISGATQHIASQTVPWATRIKAEFDSWLNTLIASDTFYGAIGNLSIMIFVLFVVRGIAKYCSNIVSTRLEEGIMKSIRDALFIKLSTLSLDYYARKKTGDIMSLLTNDVGVLNTTTINSLMMLWREGTQLVIYIVFLLLISPSLTAMAVGISVAGLVLIRFSTTYLRKYGARLQRAQADYTSTLQETVSGIRVVKGLGIEHHMVGKFTSQTKHYVRSALKNVRVLGLVPVVNDTFGILALVGVFFAGGAQLAAGNISPSNLVTFLFLLFSLMQPITVIVSTIANMQRGIAAGANVVETLDEVPSIISTSSQEPVFADRISFTDVSFAYQTKNVLNGVSFDLCKGKTIALVGSSGSGKSTILDLLLRLYEVHSGSISVDGKNIKELSLEKYRKLFGVVSQETFLFNDTVYNNISIGTENTTAEFIHHAATIAHAHEFIQHLSEGYDTVIGDRGMKISGGQRQRLAIARALARNPQILVFDEATSALDTESERIVQNAITEILQDRTAIIVAHRLSTIVNADTILVFDNGYLVESGTHAELLNLGGTYARLHALQYAATSA